MVSALARWPVILLVVVADAAIAMAQAPRGPFINGPGVRTTKPLPNGERITAKDGDTIVVEGDARIRLIRRRAAFVRLVADTERRFAIVLVEHLSEPGAPPERHVDKTYAFGEISDWPLAMRWEGHALVDEHMEGVEGPALRALGLETAHGTIVFSARAAIEQGAFASATATVSYSSLGVGGAGKQPFDQEEQRQIAMAAQNAARRTQGGPFTGGGPGYSSWMSMSSGPAIPPGRPFSPAPDGAVRVGGNVAPPPKIRDVQPQLPEEARAARLSGVVIVEITIGIDGSVTDARILRSIPLLDRAALEAVRQWKFAPPVVNGSPTPVIMTAPISFASVGSPRN